MDLLVGGPQLQFAAGAAEDRAFELLAIGEFHFDRLLATASAATTAARGRRQRFQMHDQGVDLGGGKILKRRHAALRNAIAEYGSEFLVAAARDSRADRGSVVASVPIGAMAIG